MGKHLKVLAVLVTIAITAPGTFAQKGNGSGVVAVSDVDNPARQPWVGQGMFHLPATSALSVSNSVDFFVPANKRLVIESYSGGSCTTPQGVYFSGGADVVTNGATHTHLFKFDGFTYLSGTAARTHWVGTGLVRIYADAGSMIRLWAQQSTSPSSLACRVTLTGYLVDLP